MMEPAKTDRKEQILDFTSVDQFELLKIMPGNGGNSLIRLGRFQDKQYAIKFLIKAEKQQSQILKQAQALKSLQHKHILKVYDVRLQAKCKKSNGTFELNSVMIMEYLDRGTLYEYLTIERMQQGVARDFFSQLVSAVKYMHNQGYAHRDLKLENLMVDENRQLRIIDLGDVVELDKGPCKDFVGTYYCMAPELYQGAYDPAKADVFALGVILFTLITRTPTFKKAKPTDPWYSVIIKKKWGKFWDTIDGHIKPTLLSKDFKDLIQKLICDKPSQRLTIKQIEEHPWFKCQSPTDWTHFENLMFNVTSHLTLTGRRVSEASQQKIPLDYFMDIPKIQSLDVLSKDQKIDVVVSDKGKTPDMVIGWLRWILRFSEDGLWEQCEVQVESVTKWVDMRVEVWEKSFELIKDKQSQSVDEDEHQIIQPQLNKDPGIIHLRMFRTVDGGLVLDFNRWENIHPYIFAALKAQVKRYI